MARVTATYSRFASFSWDPTFHSNPGLFQGRCSCHVGLGSRSTIRVENCFVPKSPSTCTLAHSRPFATWTVENKTSASFVPLKSIRLLTVAIFPWRVDPRFVPCLGFHTVFLNDLAISSSWAQWGCERTLLNLNLGLFTDLQYCTVSDLTLKKAGKSPPCPVSSLESPCNCGREEYLKSSVHSCPVS